MKWIKRRMKRIFCAGILILMTVLAVGTVVAVADDESGYGPYDLVIRKEIAEGSPVEAWHKEYIFKITKVESSDPSFYIRIIGDGEYVLPSSDPGVYTIEEVTGGLGIIDSGNESWYMAIPDIESSMAVPNNRVFEININKNGGKIEIHKPEERGEGKSYFQITGIRSSEKIYEDIVEVEAGGTVEVSDLKSGNYTIEELKQDKSSITITKNYNISEGDSQEVIMLSVSNGGNNVPLYGSSLSITASEGGGEFNIEKNLDNILLSGKEEGITLDSGATKVLNDLLPGRYTIECIKGDLTIDVCEEKNLDAPGHTSDFVVDNKTTIKINKPEYGEDRAWEYEFIVEKKIDDVYNDTKELKLKAGAEIEIDAGNESLPEGSYRVAAVNHNGYEVTSNGGRIGIYGKAAIITFTNIFSKEGSYHVIHEYYYKKDDQYTYEGSSEVDTFGGLSLGGEYSVEDIDRKTTHEVDGKIYNYTFIDNDEEGNYGTVETPQGTYKVVHTYYYRDDNGNISDEGESAIFTMEGDIDENYTADDVNKIYLNTAKYDGGNCLFAYEYENADYGLVGEDGKYKTVADKKSVTASQDGNEIIILKYVRSSANNGGEIFEAEDDYAMLTAEDATSGDAERLRKATPSNAEISDGMVLNSRNILSSQSILSDMAEIPDESGLAENGFNLDERGIIISGEGTDLNGTLYKYTRQDSESMSSAQAKKNGEDIIILRYYREDPSEESNMGAYNIVHEYYLRDEEGDHFEARSGITAEEASLNSEWDADYVELQEYSKITNKNYKYEADFYGKVTGDITGDTDTDENARGKLYNVISGKSSVVATEEGDEIIILKYYRTESDDDDDTEEPSSGSYRIVHEYYSIDKDGNHKFDDRSEISTVSAELDNTRYYADRVTPRPTSPYSGDQYKYEESAYGKMLQNVPDNDKPTSVDARNILYQEENGKEWVKATENGDEIIILRYVRTDDETEEPSIGSYRVVHEYYRKDKTGTEIFEGRSGITTEGNKKLGTTYTDEKVERIETSEATKQKYKYTSSAYGHVIDTIPASDGSTTEDARGKLYREAGEDEGMTCVEATEDGSQIIILKYVRTISDDDHEPSDEPSIGSYRVVHEYYLDENGTEIFEARSGITTEGNKELGTIYTDEKVEKIETSEATKQKYRYTSTAYGHVIDTIPAADGSTTEDARGKLYREAGEDEDMTCVEATEDGSQIIILKYVRSKSDEPGTPDESAAGSYKVVHTYYLRSSTGDYFEGRSGIETVQAELSDTIYTGDNVEKIRVCAANGRTYVYENATYGFVTGSVENDGPTTVNPGDSLYKADADMSGVKSTESGDQIIILKYYRTVSSGGSRPGPSSDSGTEPVPTPSEPTPENPTEPTEELPEEPDVIPELPDPNAPDSPNTVTIMVEGVPTTYVKVWNPETQEYMYIPEDEVPLWGLFLPKTGDMSRSPLWGLLAIGSIGVLWVLWSRRTRKEEE